MKDLGTEADMISTPGILGDSKPRVATKIIATALFLVSLLTSCGRETVSLEECVSAWNDSQPQDFEGFGDGTDVYIEPLDEQDRLGYAQCSVSWYSIAECLGVYTRPMSEPSEFQRGACDGSEPLTPPQIQVRVEADGLRLRI